mmetsp:Transcript_4013/g.9831  ORF Transcript_4013/g.9831 Transcript_4013/m.9831 type:complete len:247 (-) Transcript_4013:36-776(-)
MPFRQDGLRAPALNPTQPGSEPVEPLGVHAHVEVAQARRGTHVRDAVLERELHVVDVAPSARLELNVDVRAVRRHALLDHFESSAVHTILPWRVRCDRGLHVVHRGRQRHLVPERLDQPVRGRAVVGVVQIVVFERLRRRGETVWLPVDARLEAARGVRADVGRLGARSARCLVLQLQLVRWQPVVKGARRQRARDETGRGGEQRLMQGGTAAEPACECGRRLASDGRGREGTLARGGGPPGDTRQ